MDRSRCARWTTILGMLVITTQSGDVKPLL
jgi:hypothetical protein